MPNEPSTDELLDDYDLENAQTKPDSNSDLQLDGMPITDLTEPVAVDSEAIAELTEPTEATEPRES